MSEADDRTQEFETQGLTEELPGGTPAARSDVFAPGYRVSHYQIRKHLGGGGMGVVYQAEDLRLRRPVALKFLPPECSRETARKERFLREARAASALDHRNICTVYDIENHEGQLFIAMAFYHGTTLKPRLKEGPIPATKAADLARQIARGLQAAHDTGIVHRDIKPANVFVTDDDRVKIIDFGLALVAGEARLTKAGGRVGTPAYMAPEQIRGDEIGPAADIWALGVLLYEMVTGTFPFAAPSDSQIMEAILEAEVERPSRVSSGVPRSIDRVVARALQKEPGRRFQSASEMAATLGGIRASASDSWARRVWGRLTGTASV